MAFAVPCALVVPQAGVLADDEDRGRERRVVTVAFGAGLNTAQPGNSENHHILPETINIGAGDVINFVVSGLHVIRAYDDGVRLRDLQSLIPDECEINPMPPEMFPEQCFFDVETEVPVIPPLDLAVYYEGLNSLSPPQGAPPFAQASTAVNRVEAVAFLEPGRYWVICAVLPHFNDAMYAWVQVRENDGPR